MPKISKKHCLKVCHFLKKILICDKNFRWYEQSIKELGESKKLKKKFEDAKNR